MNFIVFFIYFKLSIQCDTNSKLQPQSVTKDDIIFIYNFVQGEFSVKHGLHGRMVTQPKNRQLTHYIVVPTKNQ